MGRKRKRIVRTKPIPTLPTVFDCQKCAASKTLNIDIDRKIRTAIIKCGKCKTQVVKPIRPIEERVDVFGNWLDEWLGLRLVFSFEGLVLGSIIYSLPFMVHPIQAGFANLSPSLRNASYVMGKSKLTTLIRVLLPNIKPSLITGIILAFAHTIGEFGVVLMIGGNLSGKTRVASIAIYDEVESLNYGAANTYSLILFGITFAILLMVYLINGGYFNKTEGHD